MRDRLTELLPLLLVGVVLLAVSIHAHGQSGSLILARSCANC